MSGLGKMAAFASRTNGGLKTKKLCGRTSLFAKVVVGALLVAGGHSARAEQKGALPDFGPGFSIGVASSSLPAPGLYWSQKLAFASAQQVNGQGDDTGVHTNTYLTTSMFLLSTNFHIFGARYGAYINNVGVYHANIHQANNTTGVVTSAADVEIDPIDLSWKLGNGISFGISEGFNPPTGSYDPNRAINIGHDRFTFQQHVNAGYVTDCYLLAINGVFSFNTANQHYDYTSGSTEIFDLTALRKFGRFETGPVGYYFNQFGGDSGPASLDGGKPTEFSMGWLVGYQLGKWSLNTYLTQDVYARNIGKQTKIWFSIAHKIE